MEFAIDSEEKLGIAANLLKTNDPTLKHLSIYGENIAHITSILRFVLPHVGRHLTHLQSITIYGLYFIGSTDEVEENIAPLINKQIPCLKQIKIHNLHSEVCSAVAVRLLNNSHITILSISFCRIGDVGARILARVLRHHQCALESISLDGNDIGDNGCCAIMKALLHHNSSLKSLDLSCNMIGVKGYRAIARALQKNSIILELLNLDGNFNIADQECICIANALTENTLLKELRLSFHHISNKGQNALEQAFQKNYTLHELIDASCQTKRFKCLLSLNKEKPVQAQATKTGIFPTRLMISSKQNQEGTFASTACNAQMLGKIVSFGNLSVLFSFIQECPSFFGSYSFGSH